MSMRGLIFALELLGLLQLGKSQTFTYCTWDVAIPLDDVPTSDSGYGSDAGDAAIASYQVAGASAIAELTGSDADSGAWGPADLIDTGSDPLRRLLRKRASLDCTSSETCYSIQGSPLCVDDLTNYFHLDDGTTGNLDTGDYALPDGQDGNFYTGPYPTLATSTSTAFDSATASPITIITTASDSYLSHYFAGSTSLITWDTATESAAAETEAASSTLTSQTSSLTTSVDSILATETEAPSSIPTSGTNSSTTSEGSSLATETEASSSTLTPQTTTSADSKSATETGASSSTHSPTKTSSTTSLTTSSSTPSPTTSAQAFQGAAARYPTPNLIFLAAMGLRAMF